jgi:hypothetical protein
MVVGKHFNPIININAIEGPLSLSIRLGRLVPVWILVLVCWECETVSCCVDDNLVAVWAHRLGAAVTTSSATVSAFAIFAITAPTTALAASSTIAFGYSH